MIFRRGLLWICLFLGIILHTTPRFAMAIESSPPLRTEAYQSVLQLLALTQNQQVSQEGWSLERLVQTTQAKWLRPAGTERFQLIDSPLYQNQRQPLLQVLTKLGFIAALRPQQREYDYVLLLGSTELDFGQRLAFLCRLWTEGVRFKTVYLLGGQRPLSLEQDPSVARIRQYCKKVKVTELDMMEYLVYHSQAKTLYDQIPFISINTPLQDSFKRPNTADTIRQWLQQAPAPGRILLVSSQPDALRQEQVARNLIPASFSIETVAPKADDTVLISEALDSVARWLYEIQLPFSQTKRP